MKIDQTLYPKTTRYDEATALIAITEKLDGSCLGFFKHCSTLHIAQRNCIYTLGQAKEHCTYRGLYGWLQEHGLVLEGSLVEEACVFTEWLGMGAIKYPNHFGRCHEFAKANAYYDEEEGKRFKIKNLYYDRHLFKYSFADQVIPPFITKVPLITQGTAVPSLAALDAMYDQYCSDVDRKVEGMVINTNNTIRKYIRYKNGKPKPHKA